MAVSQNRGPTNVSFWFTFTQRTTVLSRRSHPHLLLNRFFRLFPSHFGLSANEQTRARRLGGTSLFRRPPCPAVLRNHSAIKCALQGVNHKLTLLTHRPAASASSSAVRTTLIRCCKPAPSLDMCVFPKLNTASYEHSIRAA